MKTLYTHIIRTWTKYAPSALTLTLGLFLAWGLCVSLLHASPASQAINPARNAHTVPPTTTVSITYDEAVINPALVSPLSFAVHAAQTGLLTQTHGVISANYTIVVTPTRPFYPGELVHTSASTLYITNAMTNGHTISPTVWQFRTAVQGGAGLFVDSGQNLGSSNSRDVELGDLDGDGDLDAVVANWWNQTTVWLNNGGAFNSSNPIMDVLPSRDISLGDVDGDGDLDAFVANESQANSVWLNVSGIFSDSGQLIGSSNSFGVALGDLDGDGDLDAFVANYSAAANTVWLNNGESKFYDSFQSLGSSWSNGVALGDVDGDGDLDAVVANYPQANIIWLNNGAGIFDTSVLLPGTSFSYAVALGDMDGDGDLDAFVANDGPNTMWLNDGAGGFADSGQSLGNSTSQGVALGDVDYDGDLDVLVSNEGQANTLWLNDGAGNLSDSGQILGDLEDSFATALGDLDGDGDIDAFIANSGQASKVWLNQNLAELALTKTLTPSVAAPGQAVTYTLFYVNHGPQAAAGVTITDVVPISVTNPIYTYSGATPTPVGGVQYAWQIPDLDTGAGGVITITGLLSPVLAAGSFSNLATIGTGTAERQYTNNDDLVWLTVQNVAPLAEGEHYTATEDTLLDVVTATGVLHNDHDANGDLLAASLDNGPANGALFLNPDGSFTYMPDLNFNGADAFRYHASDGSANSDVVTATINVLAVNDPPLAVGDHYAVYEDTTLNVDAAAGVLHNDTDPENSVLAATLVSPTLNGTLAFDPGGGFDYTPELNFDGVDAFTYRASDGAANSDVMTATITITAVNDPPTMTAIPDQTMFWNDVTPPIPFSVGDVDTPAASLALSSQSSNAALIPTGNIIFGGSGVSRTVTLSPTTNLTGIALITVTVSDGAGAISSTFVLTVEKPAPILCPLILNNYSAPVIPPAPVLLPVVLKNRSFLPNLTPISLTVAPITLTVGQPTTITLVLQNQGVATSGGFWVDFYIDPITPPQVNQPWQTLCPPGQLTSRCQGGAWLVDGPIAPGETITLTSSQFHPGYTRWDGSFIMDGEHTLYVYVDSWNDTVPTGAVSESDEDDNRFGPLLVDVTGPSQPRFNLVQWLRLLLSRPTLP